MKHMKTVLIIEHEEQVFEKLSCDLCGAESNADERWEKSDVVSGTSQVTLEEREASAHGGHLVETSFHICPDCFRGKLKPWLESQGARATVAESDW